MPFSRHHYAPRHTSASPTDVFRLLEHLTSPAAPSATTNRRGGAFTPNFDVHETESAFVLEGELPGLQDKSDASIEFTDDNTLLVRGRIRRRSPFEAGEKQVVEKGAEPAGQEEREEVKYWVAERSVGEFQRSFSFPGAVDVGAVKAALEDGVLRIVVPKREVVKGRRIEIL